MPLHHTAIVLRALRIPARVGVLPRAREVGHTVEKGASYASPPAALGPRHAGSR